MRLLYLLLFTLFLTGCATLQESYDEDAVDRASIEAHQAQLADIENWEFQSRMAFFDLTEERRHSASLRWQSQADGLHIRLSHPLRGTLARLHEENGSAVLTDQQGEQYRASSMTALLAHHLGVYLPVSLINDALLGRIPQTDIINPQFYPEGPLAAYQVDVQDALGSQQWQVELGRYQTVNDSSLQLPHQLELTSADYQVRLNISRWTLDPSTP